MSSIRAIVVALGLLLFALPSWAQTNRPYRGASSLNIVRVLGGVFTPSGDSQYWDEKRLEFTGDEDDFEDVSVGVEYLRLVSGRFGVLISANGYEGETDQSYLDFVDDLGFPISHTTTLDTATVTAGVQFFLAPRGSVVVPYVGAGGGLYSWRLEESGDFIDFGTADLEVFFDTFESEGEAFGWYYQAGLDIPVSGGLSVFAEGRWHQADDELDEDFEGFGEIDLGGRELRAGVAFRF